MNHDADKYRLLIENLPDAFAYHQIVTDDDGTPVDYSFLEVNNAFEEMTGLKRTDVIGKRVTEVHPDIRESAYDWIAVYGKVAQGGEALRFEHYFEPSQRWYDVSAYSDEPGYFAAVFRDVSSYKNMEVDLNDLSGRLKAFIDNSPLLIGELKPGGQYLMANKALAQLLKVTTSELEDRHLEDLLPPEIVNLFNKRINSVVSKNEPVRVDDQLSIDGKELNFMTTLFPLCDASGRVSSVGSIAHDITDRIEAEKALRESEEKLSGILNNMTDVVWSITWPDFRHIYHSPALEKLYGRPSREFYDNPALFKEVTHPEDRHLTEKALEQLLKEGEAVRECRIVRPDGSIIWVTDRSKMIYDEKQQPVRVEGTTQDITKRKLLEQELSRSEERFQKMLSLVPDLISIHDADMNIIYSNWSGFGAVPVEKRILNTKCYKTYMGLDQICPNCRAVTVLQSGEAFQKEVELSEGLWVDLRIIPIVGKDHTVEFFVEWVRDISERKQAEEALLESEERFRILIETMDEGIVLKDTSDQYVHWNQTASEIFGIGIDDMKGQTTESFKRQIIREDGSEFQKDDLPSLHTLRTGEPRQNVIMGIRQGPQVTNWLKVNTRLYYKTGNGKSEGVIISFADITELKKTQEALRLQARERAAVDTFTYSVSNDLQAPLRRIEGFSEALLEECPDELSDQARDYLDRIVTQVGSMNKLTGALLQLSRVVSRKVSWETVDLNALTRSNLEKLQYQEPERQIELVVTPGLITEGDTELLNLMLVKLLDNAWKFTSGVEKARIEFGSTMQDGRTVYYLKDNGVGFDMSHADKLFVPFQRLHSENAYPGIGIGLNLVYRIISRHGGEIWAEGEPGKGACFFFTLP